MPDIAVIGPGAIGGTVAAWLAQKPGNRLTVCARTPFERLAVDAPGGRIAASPEVVTTPEAARPADWVLIATKAYDVAGAAAWLPGLVGSGTRVAVLQNGVEHLERFAPHVPTASLVPVVVDIPAERKAPGHIHQRRDGTMIVPDDAKGRDFVGLFPPAGPVVSTTPDFRTQAWRKLAINSAGAVSALVLRPSGVAADADVGAIMRALVRECVAVGRAEGAVLDDGLDEEVLAGYRASPPDSVNSLHADRLAGRPMEIDARNGAIVRFGARHDIPTPVNQIIVTLLRAATGS